MPADNGLAFYQRSGAEVQNASALDFLIFFRLLIGRVDGVIDLGSLNLPTGCALFNLCSQRFGRRDQLTGQPRHPPASRSD